MLPCELPIFPLPNVVLFPTTLLPLHIFEPRYRAMVADALEGERLIGMVMLRPGWERAYEGTPAVYPVGCSGFITHAERMPDGRYNIVLRGMEKFRVVNERPAREGAERYRVALVEAVADARTGTAVAMQDARQRLEILIARTLQRSTDTIPKDISDADLVHVIAQHLEPLEKQALLECNGPLERCEALVELLEMRMMTEGGGKSQLH
ncbi:MAG TPA: LON peptidase substrate-binding domain-containing protein [Vicinamibacterales bacterium]|nr:LON peptidase substrate-binding domain-containing protein [Vicinamibacterales bacterium]